MCVGIDLAFRPTHGEPARFEVGTAVRVLVVNDVVAMRTSKAVMAGGAKELNSGNSRRALRLPDTVGEGDSRRQTRPEGQVQERLHAASGTTHRGAQRVVQVDGMEARRTWLGSDAKRHQETSCASPRRTRPHRHAATPIRHSWFGNPRTPPPDHGSGGRPDSAVVSAAVPASRTGGAASDHAAVQWWGRGVISSAVVAAFPTRTGIALVTGRAGCGQEGLAAAGVRCIARW